MPTIAVLGTLDSKGREHAFVADAIRARGCAALLIDVGTSTPPQVKPDVTREEVASAAGLDLAALMQRRDRGECVAAMTRAAPVYLAQAASAGRIHGVISLGGSGGTSIGTAAMRALPLGFPKVMVSTLASGNTTPYIGTRDIVMFPSIVDVSGLNRISEMIFDQAAGAVCGMAGRKTAAGAGSRPLIVASMFGNTTKCVNAARAILEQAGYDVLVFHAVGTGGRAMEDLIASGLVVGVLDVTTTEVADEIAGGTLSAGPERLDAMARAGIPAVLAPGCVDMVNFGPRETVPAKYDGRTFYCHNPQVTLMRTNAEECARIGRFIAEKANASPAPVAILNPLRAVSEINGAGSPFHNADADAALFSAIRKYAQVEVLDRDEEINSPAFAEACSNKLLELIARKVPAPVR